MCVISWHVRQNYDCEIVTQIEHCEDFRRTLPEEVAKSVPVVMIKKLVYSNRCFSQEYDGILFITNGDITTVGPVFSCPYVEIIKLDEVAALRSFYDDNDVQKRLEQLEKDDVSTEKEGMGMRDASAGAEIRSTDSGGESQ